MRFTLRTKRRSCAGGKRRVALVLIGGALTSVGYAGAAGAAVVVNQGIGGIKLGSSLAQVEAILGQPSGSFTSGVKGFQELRFGHGGVGGTDSYDVSINNGRTVAVRTYLKSQRFPNGVGVGIPESGSPTSAFRGGFLNDWYGGAEPASTFFVSVQLAPASRSKGIIATSVPIKKVYTPKPNSVFTSFGVKVTESKSSKVTKYTIQDVTVGRWSSKYANAACFFYLCSG